MSTSLQQIAANPQNSAWVFASAGSGKTTILTNRVLRLLLSGVLPNKILCLTYTNAVASEMEKRINDVLSNWIICSEDELKEELKKLNGKIPNKDEIKKAQNLLIKILDSEAKIKIQTIHSFCQSLMKIFPFEAKIKPNFELLDENQTKILLQEAQDALQNQATKDVNLGKLLSHINAILDEDGLNDLIKNLLSKKENLLFLQEKYQNFSAINEAIFAKLQVTKNDDEEVLFADFLRKINQEDLFKLVDLLTSMKQKTNVKFGEEIKLFLQNPQLKNLQKHQESFLTNEGKLRTFYEKLDDEFLTIALNQTQLIAEFQDKIKSLQIAKNSAALLEFCYLIFEKYQQLKKQKACLDYDDLIIEAKYLLENSEDREFVKLKMDGGFDHILIDESQDTNAKQWSIIKALSDDFFSGLSAANNNRTIFIVGDEKQSIFSFQGADINLGPEIFNHFKNKLGADLKEIDLNISYRSNQKILDAVNVIFADKARQNAITKLGKFNNHQAHRNSAGIVEIWQQIRNEKEEKNPENYQWSLPFLEEKKEKSAEKMAMLIAGKIQNWILKQRKISSLNRPVNYGDVMILLRRKKDDFAHELGKALHKYQIPFSSISKVDFENNLLIQDLLALAKFTLLPDDDLNLAHLLKSPFFEISEEELLQIALRKNHNKSSLFIEILDKEISDKLAQIKEQSQKLNCFEFFYFFLRKENFQENFIKYFGASTTEIIDRFLEITHDFNEKFSPNLQKFLQFTELVNPEISLNSQVENSVKITTIHSAKGLQAPIVIIPDCCFNINNNKNSDENIFWIDDLPLWAHKKEAQNNLLNHYEQIKNQEKIEENLRLLYVAITRAADELYIGGFGQQSSENSWYEIIKNSLQLPVIEHDESDFVFDERNINKTANFDKKEISKIKIPQEKTMLIKTEQEHINQGLIKGKLIHKILEIFGKNHLEEKSWLKNIAQKIIAKEDLLNAEEKKDVEEQLSNFLDSSLFTEIFSGKILCEFELSYKQDLKRIDLLCERENEILIIDYKSDEILSDDNFEKYKNQLATYKTAIKPLYPHKEIKNAVLLTKDLQLKFL